MTVADCVKIMIEKSGISQRKLAEALGYSGQGAISKPLSRNDGMGMAVATLLKWAEAMDYQIVLQPMDGGDEDDLILDGEPE